MPKAEIVAIGTELLLGEIVDTNTQMVALRLRELGIDLERSCAVDDDVARISDCVGEALRRADVVITSGGLGPTVDDVTRDAVARATGVELVFHADLWEQVTAAFRRFGREPADNNRRQAYLPEGATALPNPVGTAPAFYAEHGAGLLISLPGVPRELEHLLDADVVPLLRERFPARSALRVRVLHTAGIGESDLDARIGELLRSVNPAIGLAAHPGQVDVRIAARADDAEAAEALLDSTEAAVRGRLERWIYGADSETLAEVVASAIERRSWRVVTAESGTGGALARRLEHLPVFAAGTVLPACRSVDAVDGALTELVESHNARIALGAVLDAGRPETRATLIVETPDGRRRIDRTFGGHPGHAPDRCAALCLAALHRDVLGAAAAAGGSEEP